MVLHPQKYTTHSTVLLPKILRLIIDLFEMLDAGQHSYLTFKYTLYTNQFGFGKKLNTLDAIVEFLNVYQLRDDRAPLQYI